MKRTSLLLGAAVLGLLSPHRGRAQEPDTVADAHQTAPVAVAFRTPAPIVVDGRLDEHAWSAATPVDSFTQLDPKEGEPATEETEVRFLYEGETLYIGARMHDRRPVTTRLGRRDAYISDSDWLTVILDSYHDHRTAYGFEVNPSGVRRDQTRAEYSEDDSWDPVWEVATSIDDGGWTAEMRIPLSQLRFSRAEEQTWGVQVERRIARNREFDVWSFTPKKERGGIARFGHLTGLRGLRPGNRLELLPYAVTRAEYREVPRNPAADFADPYRDGSDYFAGVGMDLKYRVTSNLTLDATVNPDFGQVELDPAEINLSAFETYYQEKRPFFVEGSEIFDFGGTGNCFGCPQLFYTRRIGAAPRLGPPFEAVYSDVPEATTILGAAKLTGKTAGGWSLGLLEAVTAREEAPFVSDAFERESAVVEPLTNWFVARARRDFGQGRTSLGALVTAVHRNLDEEVLAERLRGSAFSGGIDFRHEWADRSWSVSGFVAGSTIGGDTAVILSAQRAPARYYQRPDAAHLAINSALTTLRGYSAGLDLNKEAGEHWRGGVSLGATSPGYEINDFGFQFSTDRLEGRGFLAYLQNKPGEVFRRWSINSNLGNSWNYGRDFLGSYASVGANGQLLNYWGGGMNLFVRGGGLDDRLTRGGPLAGQPINMRLSAYFNSDFRKPYTLSGFTNFGWDDAGGWSVSASPDFGIKTATNWSLSVGPSFRRSHNAAQYAGSVADSTGPGTFGGRRYLFAELDQTTVGLGARLNYTFRPGLTLEAYAEPFLASGDYGRIRQLRAPGTFEFDSYTPAQPTDRDFNLLSLNGSGVLRWEWRPGSTLFLVWQQQRSGFYGAFGDPPYPGLGRFDLGRDVGELWDLEPDNVLLLKVNYWLNP